LRASVCVSCTVVTNCSLKRAHSNQAYYEVPGVQLTDRHLDSTGELFDIQGLALDNRCLGVDVLLKLTQKVKLWQFPVEAICNSESGLERVYQGSCILVILPFSLSPSESLRLGLNWLTLRKE